MSNPFDIQKPVQDIISGRPLQEIHASVSSAETCNAADGFLAVYGDLHPGSALSADRGILIRGSVKGDGNCPVRLQTDGDIVIEGDLSCAEVSGRRIMSGGSINQCALKARASISVGGSLSEAQVEIGAFAYEKRQIDAIRKQIDDQIRKRDSQVRMLRLVEKRLDKLFETTRISLDFSANKIIRKRQNRIAVDLRPFYAAMGACSDEEIDRRLLDFFAKGVVGLLTKANIHFLRSNPSRQRIFMSAISSLRELFFEVRALDKKEKEILSLQKAFQEEIARLAYRPCKMDVQEYIHPEVDVCLIAVDATVMENGAFVLERKSAALCMKAGEDDLKDRYVCTDTKGDHIEKEWPLEERRHIAIYMRNGAVVVDHLPKSLREVLQ